MKKVHLNLCFLDEEGNIVAKKDLKASWDLEGAGKPGGVEDVIIMDDVASMLNAHAQEVLYENIRELIDEVRKDKP